MNGEGVKTAVIVAAGKGTRLTSRGEVPKPLAPVAGVPLVRRVMDSAARAGVERFVVVVGYRADEMKKALPGLVPDGCGLTVVENPDYEKPNGTSLLLAAESVDGPFALLMSDHVFSPDRLKKALEEFDKNPRNMLVVERGEDFDGDLEDATLVKTKADGNTRLVTAIGKDLREYDAVDTGMFVLASPDVRRALREAGPGPSISDGMRRLAHQGRLSALQVGSGYWQDVDTPEDAAAAEKKLIESLGKTSDSGVTRLINRKVSLFLTSRLWPLGVTPNMVSVFTLMAGLLSGVCFAQGVGPWWGLAGATLFQLHSIVDGVDGELARLLLKESRLGYWLDMAADNLTHMAVFGGIALGQISSGRPGPWGVLGVLAVAGVAAGFAATAPALRPRKSPGAPESPAAGRLKNLIKKAGNRDFSYLLFPLALVGWLGWFLWVVTIGTWIYTVAALVVRASAPGQKA